MTKQLLHSSSHIGVPPDLALCPYCGAVLGVGFTGWVQSDDGTYSADEIEVECDSDPDRMQHESEQERNHAFDDYNESHSEMPYVFMLPIEMKIMEWVNANYCFDLENEDK